MKERFAEINIVAVGFYLERDDAELFALTDRHDLDSLEPWTKMRISVDLMSLDTGEVFGFSGRIVVDSKERDPHRSAGVLRHANAPTDEHRTYLLRLRDRLNEILESGEKT